MQGEIRPFSQLPVNLDKFWDCADFCRENDLVRPQAFPLRKCGTVDCGIHQRFPSDYLQRPRGRQSGIFVKLARKQLRIERPPVHANAYRFVSKTGLLDHLAKPRIAFLTLADVAWVNPVFIERIGAITELLQECVPVIVKISDQRYWTQGGIQLLPYFWDSTRGRFVVYRNPNNF